MGYIFRLAGSQDLSAIWDILKQAILLRKADGSNQWQDGYPNPEVIKVDIERGAGFVLLDGENVIGYVAILVNDEPQYAHIQGQWLTQGDFVVLHRVALSRDYLGKGLARTILALVEKYALERKIYSVKGDTNFDNHAMMKTFENSGYTYCGEVYFRGSPRRAYEKVLV